MEFHPCLVGNRGSHCVHRRGGGGGRVCFFFFFFLFFFFHMTSSPGRRVIHKRILYQIPCFLCISQWLRVILIIQYSVLYCSISLLPWITQVLNTYEMLVMYLLSWRLSFVQPNLFCDLSCYCMMSIQSDSNQLYSTLSA